MVPIATAAAPGDAASEPASPAFRWFVPALGVLLGGYLMFSKTFAYLRVPGTPLFVGEVVLLIGLFDALRVKSAVRRLLRTSPALRVALCFVAVCVVRFLADLPVYRVDAVRDSAIWYYLAFSFLAATMVLRQPNALPRLLRWYGLLIPVFLLWAPVAVILAQSPGLSLVLMPGTDSPVNNFKTGDFSVQVAMAVAFVWLAPDRLAGAVNRSGAYVVTVSVIGLIGLLVCGSQNRGGLLAGLTVLAVAVGCLPAGRRRGLAFRLAPALLVTLLAVVLFDVRFEKPGREVSVTQVLQNVTSVIDRSASSEALNGTTQWREQLWNRAEADILQHPGVWATGRGFGPVLGILYGISRYDDPKPTRSVHNSHLTILVRVGVTALALWLLMWLAWCSALVRWIARSRRGVRDPVVALGVWVLGSVVGHLVNAYFDPSLEGPQGGVWVYVLFGLGAVIVRTRPEVLTMDRDEAAAR